MGTCKSCNKVVHVSEMLNGICENCRGLKDTETTTKISGAIGYLNFFSWLILWSALIAGGYILFTMSYINVPHYIGGMDYGGDKFNLIGLIYGLAITFQGIFLSSLGFFFFYIAKVISQREKI